MPTTAFLMRHATANRRIKTRKNWVPAFSDKDLVMRLKRQNKVVNYWLWYMNFLLRIVTPTKWIYFSTLGYNCQNKKNVLTVDKKLTENMSQCSRYVEMQLQSLAADCWQSDWRCHKVVGIGGAEWSSSWQIGNAEQKAKVIKWHAAFCHNVLCTNDSGVAVSYTCDQ